MPRYDPTDHPLLSPAAKELSPEQLAAQADRAEALLGIADVVVEGAKAASLTLAVVLQVNRYLRLDARGDGDVVAESKGDQSVKFAVPKDGVIDPTDPEAAAIVASVLASEGGGVLPRTSSSIRNEFTW